MGNIVNPILKSFYQDNILEPGSSAGSSVLKSYI